MAYFLYWQYDYGYINKAYHLLNGLLASFVILANAGVRS